MSAVDFFAPSHLNFLTPSAPPVKVTLVARGTRFGVSGDPVFVDLLSRGRPFIVYIAWPFPGGVYLAAN